MSEREKIKRRESVEGESVNGCLLSVIARQSRCTGIYTKRQSKSENLHLRVTHTTSICLPVKGRDTYSFILHRIEGNTYFSCLLI